MRAVCGGPAAPKADDGVWMTLPALAGRTPVTLFRTEGEPCPAPLDGIPQNLHLLARLWIEVPEGGGVLRLSADDYAHAWLDGRWLGQGPAPGRPGMAWYQEYPLPAGRRLLAVHLYYQGLLNRVWQSGDGRCGVWAQLCPSRTAGAAGAATPDSPDAPGPSGGEARDLTEGWRYQRCRAYTGQPTGYDTQFTEQFDSRLWPEGWEQPGYDDAGWPTLCPAGWGRAMRRQPTAPLWRGRADPVSRRAVPGGVQLDLGRERTGTLHAVVRGHAGQRLTLRYGEELDEAGRVLCPLRCGCDYEDGWTLAEGKNRLHAFDYKGFRYVELLAEPALTPTETAALPLAEAAAPTLAEEAAPTLTECWVWERHYPLPEDACTLRCETDELEQIFTLCKNAVRCGSQEGYLDCPTREKSQYLGDAVITARAQVWLTGKTDLLRKCIGDFAATAELAPGLLAVAPGALRQEVADYSLLFAALPLTDYAFTGDLAFLRSCWPVVCGVAERFAAYQRPDGLLETVTHAWNMVDWPEPSRDGYDFALTRPAVAPGCHNVINALWVGMLAMREQMARLLGLDPAGAGAAETADGAGTGTPAAPLPRSEAAAAAFRRAFYRPEQRLFADSETSRHCSIHANAFAACFGLMRPEDAGMADAYEALLFAPGRYCGPYAATFALWGLARLGRFDAVYRYLTRTDPHGWRNMLREGATSCFEAFGKEQKWNTSLCHPWAAGALPVLVEALAGLRPDPAAPEGFVFAPRLPDALGGFALTVPFRGRRLRVEKPVPGQPAALTIEPAP